MKQRITDQDILALIRSQRSTLQRMWQPERYDVAVVMVCTDVKADLHQAVPFIAGDVVVQSINTEKEYEIRRMPVYSYDYCHIWLQNLGYQGNPKEADENGEDDPEADFDEEEEYEDGGEIDESVVNNLIQQTPWFNKEDCLPLLSIGQMIAMIQANKPHSDLCIQRLDEGYVCTINGMEFEGEELCDVLWEIVKGML